MAHVASWKKTRVSELIQALVDNPVVAIVDMHGIPGPQIQEMREGMRGQAVLTMTRNKLLRLAIDEAAKEVPGLEALKDAVDGQCALLATDMNPFKLFKKLEATKAPAAAKPGDIAPFDIIVRKGPTPFAPGPIVGDLQKIGIPAAIEGGKIVVKKDTTLVKEGEEFPEAVAKMLPKLEILPMIVGLDLLRAFEDGVLYGKDVLNIPDDYYSTMFATAAANAQALGVSIAFPTTVTIKPLLMKAFRDALGLSITAVYPTSDNIEMLLIKADSHMLAVASKTGTEDERISARLNAASAVPTAVVEEPAPAEEEEEEEEEVSEEDAAAGLSALFG